MTRRTLLVLRNLSLPAVSLSLLASFGCSATEQRSNQNTSLGSSSPQTITAPPTTSASREKLILKGKLDCRTNEVQTTSGVLENHFDNLRAVSTALWEKEYDGRLLRQIDELRLCNSPKEKADALNWTQSPARPVRASSLLQIEPEENVVWFSLLQTDFTGFTSLTDYLMEVRKQGPCKEISEKCVKCPDGNIYCADNKVISIIK